MDKHISKLMSSGKSYRAHVAVFILSGCMLGALFSLVLSSQISGNPGEALLLHPAVARPEPLERLIFVLFAALVPISSLTYMRMAPAAQILKPVTISRLMALVLSIFFCSLLLQLEFTTPFLNAFTWGYDRNIILACLIPLALLLLYLAPFLGRIMKYLPIVTISCIVSLFIHILPTRLASIQTVSHGDGSWHSHLDAMLYPLTQVVSGKTLLVDLPSQYGLFPEIIAPIFHILPLSVLTFTIVFACLQFSANVLIFLVLRRNIENHFLALFSSLALIMPTGLFLSRGGWIDIYIQYYPVRFLFPALSLFLVDAYIRRPSALKLNILTFFMGLAIVWNLDSGIVCFFLSSIYFIRKMDLPVTFS